MTDEGLRHLSGLSQLRILSIGGSDYITDDGLRHLSGLSTLQNLAIRFTGVTGDGLQHISRLPNLKILFLDGSRIDSEGIRHLGALPRLESLAYRESQVTDADMEAIVLTLPKLVELNLERNERLSKLTDTAIEHLREMNLRTLNVSGTKITSSSLAKLRAALPNCEVKPVPSDTTK